MIALQLSALTTDLLNKSAFTRFDWPWLTQRMAVLGAGAGCLGDIQLFSAVH